MNTCPRTCARTCTCTCTERFPAHPPAPSRREGGSQRVLSLSLSLSPVLSLSLSPVLSLPLLLLLACGGDPGANGTPPDAGDISADTSDVAADTGDVAASDAPDASTDIADSSEDPESDTADTSSDVATTDASDASESDTDAEDTSPVPPLCEETPDQITCRRQTIELFSGIGGLERRTVHYQLPLGDPPDGGWPVVFMFQGSFFPADLNWIGRTSDPIGLYYQVETLMRLLDAGYAVITPEAHLSGTTYWDTNIAPWNIAWDGAPDDLLMKELFAMVEGGDFGPLSTEAWYATGISSGGYMTSRMAVSYPGRFRALAIHSASYATCAGSVCVVPLSLPDDHPPTAFLHGRLDAIVPIWTMNPYEERLSDNGVPTRVIVDDSAGHEWFEASPDGVVDWFEQH